MRRRLSTPPPSRSGRCSVALVILSAQIKDDEGFLLSIEGRADDMGGAVQTSVSFTQYAVESATLSADCTEGTNYLIFPEGTASVSGFDAFSQQFGSFYCDTATTAIAASKVFVMKKLPDPATSVVLFTMSALNGGPGGITGDGTGGDPGEGPGGDPGEFPPMPLTAVDPFMPELTKSDVTFSALAATLNLKSFCFEEEFSASGEIKAWRSSDSKCADSGQTWAQETGTLGEEYKFDPATDGAAFAGVKVKVVDINTRAAFSLSTFLRFKSNNFDKLPIIKMVATSEACLGFSNLSDLYTDTFKDERQAVEVGTMIPKTEDKTTPADDFSQYTVNYTGSDSQFPVNLFAQYDNGSWVRMYYRDDLQENWVAIGVKQD